MTWDLETSRNRIKARWDRRSELEIGVEKLGRKMELENITLPKSRRVFGAHIYATVSKSGQLDDVATTTSAASTVRHLGAWLTEAAKIASGFEIPVIAAQGARLHLLNYRPIEDAEQHAIDAVLFAIALQRMTSDALNPLLADAARLDCRVGLDLGEAVGTRGGTRGDSELLFLGSAANRPAKLLGKHAIVVTNRLYDELNDALELSTEQELSGADAWTIAMTDAAHEAAIDEHGLEFSLESSARRLRDDLKNWPRSRCNVTSAKETVVFNSLGRSNSKLIEAAVLIADIDGFSDYIEDQGDDADKRVAIVALDMIRYELREILKHDYSGGVRVQYQGDNIIGLVHLPKKSMAEVAERTLEIAAGMQSSMQETLAKIVPEAKNLKVTIGVAVAETIATQLGPHGRRNAMVIGPAVTESDRLCEVLDGTEVGFSPAAYDLLSGDAQAQFAWSNTARSWVATNLTAATLALIREARDRRGSEQARVQSPDPRGRSRIGAALGATPSGAVDVRPRRPYAE